MKILALEFSSEQRSAAALDTTMPKRLGLASEAGGRTTRAFHLIEQALHQAGLEREQIDTVAIGLGPGSYTGIRVAISVAQGWQLARGIRLLGISSVEGLAAKALAAGLVGQVTIAVDAQRNEFYVAIYELASANPRPIEPLRLVSVDELRSRSTSDIIAGPEVGQLIPTARTLFPDAAALAQLAATRTDFVTGEELEPIYLRETAFVKAPQPPKRP